MTLLIEIKVPDVGTTEGIDVLEVLIQPGDEVVEEQTLAVLETDKASIDLPSSAAGTIKEVHIKAGDKVSEGSLIATLAASTEATPAPESPPDDTAAPVAEAEPPAAVEQQPPPEPKSPPAATPAVAESPASSANKVHATPSVRLFARELGVDIGQVTTGSGRKDRILKEDIKNFVKQALSGGGAQTGAGIPSIPAVDFSKFGDIEEQPLSKIKRLTGQNLSRAWLNLPMVTYHEEADITEMEAFRKQLNSENNADEVKFTGLVFIIKALVAAMQQFPAFNSSLSADGEKLIFKKYFNIGIAVDTPNGLVVPVLKDVDKKGIYELSKELADASIKARKGKLMPGDMQGGCLTISSLGGIGGTAFTPIVNAPEVAILGVTRSKMQPVWNGQEFISRLMLPLDLTYDHRVIDGAEGARFMATFTQNLTDIRRILL